MTRKLSLLFALPLLLLFSSGCEKQDATTKKLSDAQIKKIVQHSYQYVAVYNVIQKFALDPSAGGMFTKGYNKSAAMTTLVDHTVTSIARPNNDTFYQIAVLDLRQDPVVVEYPLIDSKYAVLEMAGYPHYAEIPLASNKGDFKKPITTLFYTDRTEGYNGEAVKGVDRIIKSDDDFPLVFLRAMPHQIDPDRMARVQKALADVKISPLSTFQGKPAKKVFDAQFPPYGKTDGDIFENNLLEVMQFIFNHTTFDPNNKMDQEILKLYKPLGVEPRKVFEAANVAQIDGKRFRAIADKVAKQALADMTDSSVVKRVTPKLFTPKGTIDLETQIIQSATGPIGLPASQAIYIPAKTADRTPMNAQNDYVIKMGKDELPPALAFWSITLYDLKNGFFIPNDRKKYSVGENAGFKLNDEGGIEIYISAEKPEGVPEENWLPVNREDIDIDGMIRIYSPDAEKMKTWNPPIIKILKEKK